MDATKGRFLGAFTRTPMSVLYDAKADGKKATYFGRWKGTRGAFAQRSNPLAECTIPFVH